MHFIIIVFLIILILELAVLIFLKLKQNKIKFVEPAIDLVKRSLKPYAKHSKRKPIFIDDRKAYILENEQ